ncbi:hypothetical protein Franean1_6778 [Parafrankia sp. EAN1pec]|nr:hypothetical protein Franean1_6778 [Frankia sp. EAN1pec]
MLSPLSSTTRHPRPRPGPAAAPPARPTEADPPHRWSARTSCPAHFYLHCDKQIEGVWSYLKRIFLVHLAARGIDDVFRAVKHGLKRVQYRLDLLVGFFVETGLAWEELGST